MITSKIVPKFFGLILLCLTVGGLNTVLACDHCGCYMGLTGMKNKSSFSLISRYRAFNGYSSTGQKHRMFPASGLLFSGDAIAIDPLSSPVNPTAHTTHPTEPLKSENDYEVLSSLEVHAKYYLSKRTNITLIIPYVNNSESYASVITNINGLGDINIYSSYYLVQRKQINNIYIDVFTGAGIKLPTGSNNALNAEGSQRVNFLLQAGTGSFDGFFFFRPGLAFKKWTATGNFLYKINSNNSYDERLSNSFSNYFNLARTIEINNRVMLNAGVQFYHEYTNGEIINGIKTNEHKSNTLLGGPKIELGTGRFLIYAELGLPLYEVETDHISGAGRMSAGVSYTFTQNQFLFQNKSK